MRLMNYMIAFTFMLASCSYLTGPNGVYPSTKYDFIEERVEEDLILPDDFEITLQENHYPIIETAEAIERNIPKPRQIFATSGDSSVQLRRLGELMWIYVETLPSTSWPISKSYWETSRYSIISLDPDIGEIVLDLDDTYFLNMKIEHGIKEASTEIFLNQIDKSNNQIVSNITFIQSELEQIVNYFAENVGMYSGTSLAAQNLNEIKKARIFADQGQTVIELNLSFDRAWSSVSRAMASANIVSNDRDRSNGSFLVSYATEKEKRFFSFLNFGQSSSKENISFNDDAKFEVKITEKNKKTYVRAYSKDGKINEAEELISKINESLN